MQPMTSSCANELIRNVVTVANGLLMVVRDAEYTWRRKKWCTGIFHSRENSSQSRLFHQSA
jgi:hypothetical protein